MNAEKNTRRIEYRLITSMDEEEFAKRVNVAIEEGYSLQGGVASRGACLLQAVTREVEIEVETEPEPEAEPEQKAPPKAQAQAKAKAPSSKSQSKKK